MARITKGGRFRKPLDEGGIGIGWKNMPSSRGAEPAELFTLIVGSHTVEMTRDEAQSMCLTMLEKLADEDIMRAAGLLS